MKRRLLAMIAAVAVLGPIGGSNASRTVPVVDFPDTPLSSPNVHLVTNVHTGSAVGGKFGWIGSNLYYFQTTVRAAGVYIPSGIGTGGVTILKADNPERPVPVGFLPIPGLTQNEDVELSMKRRVLLVSMDNRAALPNVPLTGTGACTALEDPAQRAIACRRVGGILFVVDISIPEAPRLRSFIQYADSSGTRPDGRVLAGPGHTASCILDCNYAYISGGRIRGVTVVDLRNLDAPKIIGTVASPAGADGNGYVPGTSHDVHTDRYGNVWIAGSGGTAMYAPIKNPLKPVLLATVSPADNVLTNQLIHHGVVRYDATTVLIGEEQFSGNAADACGKPDAGRGDYDKDGTDDEDGSFQVWKIDAKAKRLRLQDTWDTELVEGTPPKVLNDTVGIGCSSHWFDYNSYKVVADGWYEQGLRFLDISNQRKIRQVGFWMGPATAASQAQFVPGRPDLVYVADYSRGLDIVRIDGGGRGAPAVSAPIRAEWFKSHPGFKLLPRLRPDDTFGYACRVPAA
jgi:hypothetical protein